MIVVIHAYWRDSHVVAISNNDSRNFYYISINGKMLAADANRNLL